MEVSGCIWVVLIGVKLHASMYLLTLRDGFPCTSSCLTTLSMPAICYDQSTSALTCYAANNTTYSFHKENCSGIIYLLHFQRACVHPFVCDTSIAQLKTAVLPVPISGTDKTVDPSGCTSIHTLYRTIRH
ncbi:hypothetical protein F5B17DRAFT_282619 [Nemania serpens]|nr:hypothetical protein F5B17DRAFT_282619 [Nemania serpens]